MTRTLLVACAIAIAALGCKKTEEPDASPKAEAPGASSSSSPLKLPPSHGPDANAPMDIAWDAPPSFEKSENKSAMRKATYKIKAAAGDADDAELSVTQAGGGVQANVKRWSGQFDNADPTLTPKTVNGIKVTMVELKGTYAGMSASGAAAGAKPGYMLLGAIVETHVPTFFKLTGPEKTVKAARADFEKLVDSIRAK